MTVSDKALYLGSGVVWQDRCHEVVEPHAVMLVSHLQVRGDAVVIHDTSAYAITEQVARETMTRPRLSRRCDQDR